MDRKTFHFAKLIHARRVELKISLTQLAELTKLPITKLRQWEVHFDDERNREYISTLGRALQCDLDLMFQQEQSVLIGDIPTQKPRTMQARLSKSERAILGTRAKERRKKIGYKAATLAFKLGMTSIAFGTMEKSIPLVQKFELEDKWEQLLAVPKGWLRNINLIADEIQVSAATDISAPTSPVSMGMPSYPNVSQIILGACIWAARKSLAKRTFDYSSLTIAEKKWADILSARYGVAGADQTTLQAIGDRHGVTRERIRQVTQKMIERLPSLNLDANRALLETLKAEVDQMLPVSIAGLDKNLRSQLGERLSIVDADRFSREVFGIAIAQLDYSPIKHSGKIGREKIAAKHTIQANVEITHLFAIARKMIRNCGAANLQFVVGEFFRTYAQDSASNWKQLLQTLQTSSKFEWLVENQGWFWFGQEPDNKLIHVAAKILAAADGRVDVEDIATGLLRSRKQPLSAQRSSIPFQIEPPLSVCNAVLNRAAIFKRVQWDDFEFINAESKQNLAIVLAESELLIHQLIKQSGGTIARYTLVEHLVKTQLLDPVTMSVSLDHSPIFSKIARGVFVNRGCRFTAESMQVALASVDGKLKQQ